MNHFNQIKSGAKIATPYLIILYFFFVGLDIYTTYLASPNPIGPDLRFESNWIIKYFQLTWFQVILFASISVLLLSSLFCISLFRLNDLIKSDKINYKLLFELEKSQKKYFLMYLFVLSCFYTHLIFSIIISVNNYLCFLYLHRIENAFKHISIWYVNLISNHQPYFHLFCFLIAILLSMFLIFYTIKMIRNKQILIYD
jgi:hypothetical protein